MNTKELQRIQDALLSKISREYQDGYNHVNEWRSKVQDEIKTLQDYPVTGQIKIDLIKENTDFERATFLSDDIEVDFVTNDGIIASRQIKELKSVYKFDYIDSGRKNMKDQIIIDNCNYGIAVEAMDMFDEDENQPMSILINPDTCIPDPKCTYWSGMRYFWFSRKILAYKLKNKDVYNLQWMEVEDFSEDRILQDSNQARTNDLYITSNEGFVDLYEHYTIFEGKKYLTTWVNERSILIRAIEIAPLTKAEELDQMKCNFGIIFHRRKPFPYRWAGYRIWEEVGNEQDIITQLKTLEIEQAKISAHWPDLYINQWLGVDSTKLSKLKRWWRIIPVSLPPWQSLQQQMFEKNYNANINTSAVTSQWLYDRAKRNTNYTDLTFWASPNGGQTKGEIQQLQANANKFIAWVGSNYMNGEQEYAYLWYRSYQENMSPKAKKIIALFDKWGQARTLKKSEFISDGKIIINITSTNQQKIINEQAVTKLMALSEMIVPTLSSEYAKNTYMRTLVDKSWIEWVAGEDLIPQSVDESLALSRVEMINNNIPIVSKPMPWEDLNTHISIYEKCIDTPSREAILALYTDAKVKKDQMAPAMQADVWGANIAKNMMVQQSNPNTIPVATM